MGQPEAADHDVHRNNGYLARYHEGQHYQNKQQIFAFKFKARKGVTGSETEFSRSLGGYLQRCRAATDLPLAVGFGVKEAGDVDFLRGKADIAVVGTQSLRVLDEQGVSGVGKFVASLV